MPQHNRLSDRKIRAIHNLTSLGWSRKAVGKAVGCSDKAVRRHLSPDGHERERRNAKRFRDSNPGRAAEIAKDWRDRYPGRHRECMRRAEDKNPDLYRQLSRENQRKQRANDPERFRAKARDLYWRNPEESRRKALLRKYNREGWPVLRRPMNQAERRAAWAEYASRRRARVREATPEWADPGEMRQFFHQASHLTAKSGVRHDVDHIVPLQNREVCGLHCEANLRVVPATVNRRKSNRFDGEVANAG